MPSLLAKAERQAKSHSDPVQRERLLYTIRQQVAALAANLATTMEESRNATDTKPQKSP